MARTESSSLDANCLLRWVLKDDDDQFRAMAELLSQPGAVYHAGDIALFEVAYVLEGFYKLDRSVVAQNLIQISSQTNINYNRQLLSGVLPMYLAHPSLSFADCCLAIQAELNDALPLYTFDKKLVNQSGGRAKLVK